MDSNEVIIEKVIKNNRSNKCNESRADIEKTNDVSKTTKNCSTSYEENIQNNIKQTSQDIDDCEATLIDNVEIKQNHNEKDNMNEQQQKSVIFSNIEQNEIFSKNHNASKGITFENLKPKDDDICIVHEKATISSTQKNDKVSSLISIAIEYGSSDSETEYDSDKTKYENNLNKHLENQIYRQNKEISSSEESDSEDDSTSSSDSSVIVDSNESDSDDSSKTKSKGNNVKGQKHNEMKNELDDLPPIEDLKISVPEVLCDPLGEVAWMVKQLVVVKPKPGKPTLNLDTVLFIEKGQRALGKIFDVFGQVNEPHYCVRFNSSEHIKECDIKVGLTVYYCPNTEYTSLVFLHELMKIKGIDANADDPPEFSDDEEERVYYEQLKLKQANNANQIDIPFKRKRISKPNTGWQTNHPWNRNMQKQRKGFYSRTNRQLFSVQSESQTQNSWSQSYQNSNQQYGYGAYSLQPMQYMNHNVSSVDQNFYGSQNYYNEDSTTAYLNPRIPFNACPRVPPSYLPFQNHSNSSTNVRFQTANTPWLSQVPQIPMRMKIPWVPLPPPPPPLPPTSSTDTT